ncbi:TetR/AcrR family transcriptional regulator [Dactylosporangium sp. CS-047395]|uniref:TetR/AcrR family transcriptional regulator n=1 Tax=Dactylosporangium sp. CS-047395 TaxID=3239936 RepID=UPI003D8AC522
MTEPQAPRRRAPGMSTEQRREMILQSALPLVAEYGNRVTTAQIARAAGIGEATIFRVFADKEELLRACIARALDPSHLMRQLETISLEQPLDDRLLEAAEALQAHLGRMGAVVGALHSTGMHAQRTPPGPGSPAPDRARSQAETKAAVAELFEPDKDRLRLPVSVATDAFLGFMFARGRSPLAPEVTTADLVDLFLHGALAR